MKNTALTACSIEPFVDYAESVPRLLDAIGAAKVLANQTQTASKIKPVRVYTVLMIRFVIYRSTLCTHGVRKGGSETRPYEKLLPSK